MIQSGIQIPPKINIETKNETENQVKNKIISFSENNNFSHSILDSESGYDEYEEDKTLIQWQLPKTKKLPTLSSLVCFCSVIYLSRINN